MITIPGTIVPALTAVTVSVLPLSVPVNETLLPVTLVKVNVGLVQVETVPVACVTVLSA